MKLRYLTYVLLGLITVSPVAQVQAEKVSTAYRICMGLLGAGCGYGGLCLGRLAIGTTGPALLVGALGLGLASNAGTGTQLLYFGIPSLLPIGLGCASATSFLLAGLCFHKALKSYDDNEVVAVSHDETENKK